jgi:hypothetical protein
MWAAKFAPFSMQVNDSFKGAVVGAFMYAANTSISMKVIGSFTSAVNRCLNDWQLIAPI